MKIGIITLHYALNAGAVLQAFALQTYLKSLGHEVEFIDYVPKHQYSLRSFIAKSPYVMYNKWKDIYYPWRCRICILPLCQWCGGRI